MPKTFIQEVVYQSIKYLLVITALSYIGCHTHTGQDGFMSLKFSASHAQRDITEAGAVKEGTQVIAEAAFGHFDRGTTGLA